MKHLEPIETRTQLRSNRMALARPPTNSNSVKYNVAPSGAKIPHSYLGGRIILPILPNGVATYPM